MFGFFCFSEVPFSDVSDRSPDVVSPTGVSAVGAAGTVAFFTWADINDAQTPNWVDIDTSI